jgi:hypothetical protein
MMWRFIPLGEPDVDVWLSRDGDSRATLREKAMIDEWLGRKDQRAIHTILDHSCHSNLMGCGFAVNNLLVRKRYPELIIDVRAKVAEIANTHDIRRGYDQNWIGNYFKDVLLNKKDVFVHMQDNPSCIERCHIHHKKIIGYYDYCLVPPVSDFVGKQINHDDKIRLPRPTVCLESLKLNGVKY